VGVMGHELVLGEDILWSWHPISTGDNYNLQVAHGNVSASLVSLSVSGNTTSLTILVNNSASFPIDINALAVHGNFTVLGDICQTAGWRTGNANGFGGQKPGDQHSPPINFCQVPAHIDEVVFVPVAPAAGSTSTSTSSGCSTGTLSLVNGLGDEYHGRVTLGSNQCMELTFVGELTFGQSPFILVPSTAAGQTYSVTVIGSNGANQQINCLLPLGPGSCKVAFPKIPFGAW